MAWYDEAIFYHIYPLGLCGAEKQNTYEGVSHRLNDCLPWVTTWFLLAAMHCTSVRSSNRWVTDMRLRIIKNWTAVLAPMKI